MKDEVTIDLSIVYDVAGNDETYIRLMVKTFLDTMPTTMKNIKQLAKAEDWDNLYRMAHYSKSTLSIIKVDDMYQWAQTIEKNARNQENLGDVPGLVEKMEWSLTKAVRQLEEQFAEESAVAANKE